MAVKRTTTTKMSKGGASSAYNAQLVQNATRQNSHGMTARQTRVTGTGKSVYRRGSGQKSGCK